MVNLKKHLNRARTQSSSFIFYLKPVLGCSIPLKLRHDRKNTPIKHQNYECQWLLGQRTINPIAAFENIYKQFEALMLQL